MTSSRAGKKRKADIQKAQEIYEEKKRNKRLQSALADTMRALPPTQENFQNFAFAAYELVCTPTQFRKSKKQQKKRAVVQMNNISYMMGPVQQRSHYFTNQQVSF